MAAAPPRVWRLTTARYAETALSGDGARRYGGRWNPKGTPVVYTAATLSLAMLELLVQDQPLRARYVAIPIELPPNLAIERLDPEGLPTDWREPAARDSLRALGADWIRRRETAVLAVPSAVIPIETNYLLNPAHPDFGRIGVGPAEALVTDLRLLPGAGDGRAVPPGAPAG